MKNPNFKHRLIVAAVAAAFSQAAISAEQFVAAAAGTGGLTTDTATLGDGATNATSVLTSSGLTFTDFTLGQTPTTTVANQLFSIDDGLGQTVLIDQTGI